MLPQFTYPTWYYGLGRNIFWVVHRSTDLHIVQENLTVERYVQDNILTKAVGREVLVFLDNNAKPHRA